MLPRTTVKELLNESACAHNKTKKTSCDKTVPGATSGGCAFEGAQIALFPYADAIHLVHGPQTCLGASWETRQTPTRYKGRDHTQMGFTTGISLNDVIFGGEARLSEAIDYCLAHYTPEALFVYATCVTAMVGDDIDAVCHTQAKKYPLSLCMPQGLLVVKI